jgi:hypothetical protein
MYSLEIFRLARCPDDSGLFLAFEQLGLDIAQRRSMKLVHNRPVYLRNQDALPRS